MCAVLSNPDDQARQSILATRSGEDVKVSSHIIENPPRHRQAFSLHEDEIDRTNSSGSSDVTVNAYSEGEYGILRVRRHARRNMPPLPCLEKRSHRNTIPDVPTSAETAEFEELLEENVDCSALANDEKHKSIMRAGNSSTSPTSLIRPQISPRGPRPYPASARDSVAESDKASQNTAARLEMADTMIDAVIDEVEKHGRSESLSESKKSKSSGGYDWTRTGHVAISSSADNTMQSAYVTDVDSSEAERFVRDRDFSPRRKHFYDRLKAAQRQSQESGLVDPVLSEGAASDGASSDCHASAESMAAPASHQRGPSFIRVPSTIFPHTPASKPEPQQAPPSHARSRSASITPLQMGVRRSARGTFWNPLPGPLRMPGCQAQGQMNAETTQELPRFIVQRESVQGNEPALAANDEGGHRESRRYTRQGFRATIYPRKTDDFAKRSREPLSQEYLFADYASALNASKQGRRRSMSLSSANVGQPRPAPPQVLMAKATKATSRPLPSHARVTRKRASTIGNSERLALCSWCSECEDGPASHATSESVRTSCCLRESGVHDDSSSSCSCCSCSWCQVAKDKKPSRGLDMRCSVCSIALCKQCASRASVSSSAHMVHTVSRGNGPVYKSVLASDSRPDVRCDSPSLISSGSEEKAKNDDAQILRIYPGAPVLAPLPVLSPFYIDPYRFWPSSEASSSYTSELHSPGNFSPTHQGDATTPVIAKATITSQTSATARLCAPGEVLRRRRPISRRLSRQRRAAEILLELQDDAQDAESRHCESCYNDCSPQTLDYESESCNSGSAPTRSSSPSSDGGSSISLTTASSSSPSFSTSSEAHTPPRSQYSFANCESPGKRLSAVISPLATDESAIHEKTSTELSSITIGTVPSAAPVVERRVGPPLDAGSISSDSKNLAARRPALRSILKSTSDTSSRVSTLTSSTDARSTRMTRGTPSASISCYSTSSGRATSRASTNGTTGATKASSESGQRRTTVKLIVPSEKPTAQRRADQKAASATHAPDPRSCPSQSASQPLDLDSRLQREAHRKVRNDERLCTLDKLEGRSKKSSLFTQLQALRSDTIPRVSGGQTVNPPQHKTTAKGVAMSTTTVKSVDGGQVTAAKSTLFSDEDDAAFPASPLSPTKAQLRALEHAYEVQQQQSELQNAADMRLADVMTGFDVGIVPRNTMRSRSGSRSGSDVSQKLVRGNKGSTGSGASSSSDSMKTTSSGDRVLHSQLRKFSLAVEARQMARARCVDQ